MSVNNIKSKIKALKTLGLQPSDAIACAWQRIHDGEPTSGDAAMITGFIGDIVAIAEDMEKPAKAAEGEAK